MCANNVATWLIETVGFEGNPAAGFGMTASVFANSLSKAELNDLAAIMELYKNNLIENPSALLNEISTTLSENGAYKIVYDRANNTIIKQINAGNGTGGYLNKPEQGGTLNIGAGNKPIEGAYNISHPDYPMGKGVYPGNANDLPNIATGSQNRIIMENPYKYDPLNNEILRVLSSEGTITIKGSISNGTLRNLEKNASDKGLVLINKTKVPNNGHTQTNGKSIGSSELIEYTFKKK